MCKPRDLQVATQPETRICRNWRRLKMPTDRRKGSSDSSHSRAHLQSILSRCGWEILCGQTIKHGESPANANWGAKTERNRWLCARATTVAHGLSKHSKLHKHAIFDIYYSVSRALSSPVLMLAADLPTFRRIQARSSRRSDTTSPAKQYEALQAVIADVEASLDAAVAVATSSSSASERKAAVSAARTATDALRQMLSVTDAADGRNALNRTLIRVSAVLQVSSGEPSTCNSTVCDPCSQTERVVRLQSTLTRYRLHVCWFIGHRGSRAARGHPQR